MCVRARTRSSHGPQLGGFSSPNSNLGSFLASSQPLVLFLVDLSPLCFSRVVETSRSVVHLLGTLEGDLSMLTKEKGFGL